MLLQMAEWEKKSQNTWHLYKTWLHKCHEICRGDIEFKTQNKQKTRKTHDEEETSFPKENTGLDMTYDQTVWKKYWPDTIDK